MQFPQKKRYHTETAEVFEGVPLSEYCGAASWFRDLAENSFEKFKQQGLPGAKLERWKYSPLLQAVKDFEIQPTGSDMAVECDADYIAIHELDHKGLRAFLESQPPQHNKYKDMALWYLNTAFMSSVIVIDIPEGVAVDVPFHLGIRSTGEEFSNDRIVIRLGKKAKARVIEFHDGDGQYWKNNVIQVTLDDGAHLEHIRILEDSEKSVSTTVTHIEMRDHAQYDGFIFNAGAKLSRQQIHADLKGENIKCDMNAIHLLGDSNHADATFEVAHHAPNCESNQLVRSVLDGQSKGIFQGKVFVDRVAQKTDGYQLSNALILSEGAEMNTKPELEIYADDVKCSHGATTGQIDEDMLFYLRSRGLDESAARGLLIEAFVGEAVDNLADVSVKTRIMEKVRARLEKSS